MKPFRVPLRDGLLWLTFVCVAMGLVRLGATNHMSRWAEWPHGIGWFILMGAPFTPLGYWWRGYKGVIIAGVIAPFLLMGALMIPFAIYVYATSHAHKKVYLRATPIQPDAPYSQ